MESSQNNDTPQPQTPASPAYGAALPSSRPRERDDFRYLYFAAFFVLGVSVGLLGAILGFRHYLFNFHPQPEEFAQDISDRIADDFNLPDATRQKIADVIRANHPKIQEAVEESFRNIHKIQENVANEVADLFPNPQDRQRWLKEYDRYFPKPPRPEHPEDGPFPGEGPHGPPPHRPDFRGDPPRH